jgi:methyl-accepting chemotaxis protein
VAFYKRSVFLINPRFQLRFSLIFAGIVFISSLVYPLIFMDYINLLVTKNPGIQDVATKSKEDLLLLLIPIQILFAILAFIVSIFMTHKIAGPMYKLKNHLADIRLGDGITPLTFRRGDHFHDVAEEVSLFLEAISLNQESDFEYLDEVSSYVSNLTHIIPEDKRPVLNEISRRLNEVSNRYKKEY